MRRKILELLKTTEGKTVAKHNTWIWGQGVVLEAEDSACAWS